MSPRLFLITGVMIAAGAVAARAGLDVPPAPVPMPDLSGFATKSDLGSIQSLIPQPASTAPPMETPGGGAGSANTFRRGDAVQPRITRSKTVTLAADGTATFDWTTQGALVTPVQVALAPVYSGSGVPKCWITSVTATAASVKCVVEVVTLLSIAGVGVGSVTNSAPAGMQVGIIALPPS